MEMKPEWGCVMECKCCKLATFSQPQPTSANLSEPLDNAALQLCAESSRISRDWHNPQGACQGGGGERGEEEADLLGNQWP